MIIIEMMNGRMSLSPYPIAMIRHHPMNEPSMKSNDPRIFDMIFQLTTLFSLLFRVYSLEIK